ncbi:MAG TPA: hypothetical protein VHE61_12470 [Opitutaceae bacterium]|nr:hypothetical protein [Opitutaceae bacterium]
MVAAPAWFAVLALGMNRTAGQAALTFHPFGTLQRRPFLQTGMAAVTVGTMAIGLAAFRQRVVRGRWSLVSIRSHPYGWAVGVMAVGLVFVVDQPPRIALRA